MSIVNALPTVAKPRFDLYRPIHKALRAFMGDTLVTVGKLGQYGPFRKLLAEGTL